ncbi:uncharacterized protein EV420DRAFT_1652540 [Desarmillaria tabescens]|uniref:Ribonuclease H1 N-terminal domain-containing protein n=1 Tax=Armillaria tabescens TaxID=1929756 RepID=A0AA39J548_ARMTA|nr:uncharacterized protein EV420DRAFT_1652540 [Desarmillaria tabescens]KAK0436330.1 hypothetical protein EV420DRAFT_1652540 [Desarmillaria tabescens]
MTQFTLEQLAAALSVLGISVPVMDASHVPDVHANASAQAAPGPLQTTIHCANCSYPNAINISAVPTLMGVPLPRSRVGGQTSSPALATSATLRVPSVPIRSPAGPTPVVHPTPTPTSYAHPAPVPVAQANPAPVPIAQANPAPVPVAQANPAPVPIAQANPAPVPVAQANPAPVPVAQANPAPAPISTDSSSAVPQSATASITTGPDGPWYVVSKGRDVGVFRGWQQISNLVTGVGRACFFRCSTRAAAQVAFNEALAAGAVEIL